MTRVRALCPPEPGPGRPALDCPTNLEYLTRLLRALTTRYHQDSSRTSELRPGQTPVADTFLSMPLAQLGLHHKKYCHN